MGISGLLPLLKSIHKNTTLKKFAGQTIGIDGYGWLHRGAVACALELALDKPTTKYVDFAMSRVRMLLDFGITPYMVFDGDNLPSKSGTNEDRRKKRDEAKALGLSLYKAGKTAQAQQELQKATGVTPYMARLLIEELKKLDIRYIVAPYEADAQLAYLERQGIIDGILSEDSDLLVFGAKRLITKLNQYGECVEIDRTEFPLCKEISLAGWTDAMFRRMAILSGCDYLPNIDKMGLKTAYRFVRKYKEAEKTIRMIAFEGKFCVPQEYMTKFKQAELTFIHHRVFCPVQQRMVFLSDLPRGISDDDMPYLGAYVDPETAIGVACGDLNPKNKQPIELKSVIAARPPLRDSRRQTLGTPSDLKKKSSIDNFFKPSRTPLQELDPNSLTPSPSQQRLLERHRNASWEVRPVNSAPQLRRAVTTFSSGSGSVEHRDFLARASTMSTYQRPKRQRLCSEVEDVSPSKEVKQSPFFSSIPPIMSPSNQRKSRLRKAKKEFDIWSDDSVDGILLGLVGEYDNVGDVAQPEPEIERNKHTKCTQLDDSCESLDVIPQSSPVLTPEDSQGPQYSNNGTQTQAFESSGGAISQRTAVSATDTNDSEEIFEDLLEYHIEKQKGIGPKVFTSLSSQAQMSALKTLSSPKKRAASSPTNEEPNMFESVVPEKCMTTNVNASSITSPPRGSGLLKTFIYQSPEIQRAAFQSLGKPQSDAEKVEIGKFSLLTEQAMQPSGSGLSAKGLSESATNLRESASKEHLRGSEDALVPDSEEEVSGTEDGFVRSSISLKCFAFTG